MTNRNKAHKINAEIELSVYGPLGSEQATAASSWETAKLLADAFERIERLESQIASRAALAEPEPEGPADADLHAMAFRFAQPCFDFEYIPFARAVLARWGNHPGSPDSSTQPS